MPWYALLFDKPYQEQYARYLRLPAFDDPDVLAEAMNDEAHDRWFKNLKRERPATWNTAYRYLPPVAQFCRLDDAVCDGKTFTPKPHGFVGTVAIILDDNCVSSCTGFAWNISRVFGLRATAFGMPDSGDSNYARMPLRLIFVGSHWLTRIGTQAPDDKDIPLVTANVMVTQTTDANGNPVSGHSSKVAVDVPRFWNDREGDWANRVLKVALKKR